MTEPTRAERKIIHAVLGRNPQYVRITDWEGKSLTFILAEEIHPVEKPPWKGPEKGKEGNALGNAGP